MKIKLQKNIGLYDRVIRGSIAIGLLLAAFWFKSILLLAASLFTFFEVFASWCLWYQIIGKNSCPLNSQK